MTDQPEFPNDAVESPRLPSDDDTYAVAAYILSLNGIVPADGKLDSESLPKPHRDVSSLDRVRACP